MRRLEPVMGAEPVDLSGVRAQIAWFEEQGLVKQHVNPDEVIDTSYMPTK